MIPLPYLIYSFPEAGSAKCFTGILTLPCLALRKAMNGKTIENMIENFAFLIHQYGFIPNGNRSYFLSRSQPPYFSFYDRTVSYE
jgi:alpha,alpha-trehalase